MFEFYSLERLLSAFLVGAVLTFINQVVRYYTRSKLASTSTLGPNALSVFIVTLAYLLAFIFERPQVNFYLNAFYLLILISLFVLISLFLFFESRIIRKKAINKLPYLKKLKRTHMSELMSQVLLLGMSLNFVVVGFFSVSFFLSQAYQFSFPSSLWFGHFRYVDPLGLKMLSLAYLVTLVLSFKYHKRLTALSFGLDYAESHSVRLGLVEILMIVFVFLCTHLVIYYYGVFSFLGLVMAHILAQLSSFRSNLLRSLLLGPIMAGVLVMSFDLMCYSYPIEGAEFSAGLIITFLGSLGLGLMMIKEFYKKSFANS